MNVRGESAPCSVVYRTITRLQIDEAGNSPDAVMPVIRTESGHFVASSSSRHVLTRWTPAGALDKTVEALGDGPGEFRGIGAVYRDAADSVHVMDRARRWHVYDSTLRWSRSVQGVSIAFPASTAFLDDGNLLLALPNGPIGKRDSAFYVVRRSDGAVLRKFGVPRHDGGEILVAYRGGSTFWAVSPTRYEMELWDLSGEKLATIKRSAKWFDNRSESEEHHRDGARIGLVHLDDTGVLWVAGAIVETDPRTRRPRASGFWVEAFTESGKLLVSQRYSSDGDFMLGFLDHSQGIRFIPTETGITRVEVVEYRLVGNSVQGSRVKG